MDKNPIEATDERKDHAPGLDLSKLHGFKTLNIAATAGDELADAFKQTANKIGDTETPAQSDRRLKSSVSFKGITVSGLCLYDFQYAGDPRSFTGVMAQDLLDDGNLSHAVTKAESGYLLVNYAALDLQHLVTPAMREAGAQALAKAPVLQS